jgi:hypothetical protein
MSFKDVGVSAPIADLAPGEGVGGSCIIPKAEFAWIDLELRACALRKVLSRDEDGDELLLGVLVLLEIACLLFTRLAGS